MKKITNYITLKFISITLISLLLAISSIQIASMLKIRSDIVKIENRWDEVQIEQSEKLRLENALHTFLGFGVMTHSLRKSIINNDIETYQRIHSDLYAAEGIVKLYLRFKLSKAERYALQDILSVIREYQYKFETLPSSLSKKMSLQSIEQDFLVDDKPALQGLEVLMQFNRESSLHLEHYHDNTEEHDDHGIHDNSDDNDSHESHDEQDIHENEDSHDAQYAHASQDDLDGYNSLLGSSEDKFILFTDIIASLGYGGLVYNITNYEIKPSDLKAQAAQRCINKSIKLISKFKSLSTTAQEQKALQQIMNLVSKYQRHFNNLKKNNNHYEENEMLLLVQSEKNALQALQIIHKQVEVELKNKVIEVDQRIHSIQTNISTLIVIIILVTIATILLMAYILFQRVIAPLQRVTVSMVQLARQNHKSSVSIYAPQIFEIKQMFRSIRIFKKYENKRRITENSLTKMHDTALQQLAEIQDLQQKSEQKTEQAMSLANNLTELQRIANADRKQALESMRRIDTILNTVHDAIISTDINGDIESINIAAEMMFSCHASEIIGQNISSLIEEEYVTNYHKIIDRLSQKRRVNLQKGLELLMKRSDGSIFPVEIFLGQSKLNDELSYTAVIRDITQRKKDEQAIQRLALTDPLTSLANRRHFNQELSKSLNNQKRTQTNIALLMIDLDNFKPVNDTFGHNIGDKTLQRIATRLGNIVRNVDHIARLGGDEFAIILNNIKEPLSPSKTAQKIIDSLSKPILIDDQIIQIGATIGISFSPQDATQQKELLSYADEALYKAKSLGKGQYCLYQNVNDDQQ